MYVFKYDGTASENKEALQKYGIRVTHLDNLLHPPNIEDDLEITINGDTKTPQLPALADHSAQYTRTHTTPIEDPTARYIDTRTGKTYQTLAQALNNITPADLKQAQKKNSSIKTKLDYITHHIRPITKLQEKDLTLPELNLPSLKILTTLDDHPV